VKRISASKQFSKCTGLLFFLLFLACTDKKENPSSENSKKDTAVSRSNKTFLTDCAKLLADARKMDSLLLKQTEVDPPSANKAIVAFADFANYCHNDSLSPVYLIKCAQVARSLNNIPQAKIVLDKCVQDYPRFKDRPAAMFLLAQLYDEDTYLNDESEAEKLYQQIIDEYPTSDWALSAKGAIGFLGKSDEQIIKQLKGGRKK
jgi:tetratricopeptide (TPR) repeat protein